MKLINPKIVNERLIAVDIGKSGGLCFNEHKTGYQLSITQMLSEIGMAELFIQKMPHIAVAEDVHTFGGQGIVSSGVLMEQKGVLIGICRALRIKLVFIQPKEWIQCYTLKGRSDFQSVRKDGKTKNNITLWKKHLIEIAQSLKPDTKFTSGTADAFLMWNYYASILVNDRLPSKNQLTFKL